MKRVVISRCRARSERVFTEMGERLALFKVLEKIRVECNNTYSELPSS